MLDRTYFEQVVTASVDCPLIASLALDLLRLLGVVEAKVVRATQAQHTTWRDKKKCRCFERVMH